MTLGHFNSLVPTLILILAGVQGSQSLGPIVDFGNASFLEGLEMISRNGRPYSAFLGIKYGIIPGRFKESNLSPAQWNGTRQATEFGPFCAQNNQTSVGFKLIGQEDCLHLNIYTPKVDRYKLPVIVFIHPGGFLSGSGDNFGAKYLMDEELVLVTINYRVGILGFLNTQDQFSLGNFGMKDQVLALKWIKLNIAKFGGDPSRVLLSGESAGGASVIFHCLSPLSKGLFHAGLSQSGSPLNPWAYADDSFKNAHRLGNRIGCNATSNEQLVKCLRDRPLSDLIRAQGTFLNRIIDNYSPFPITLEVKGQGNPHPFLTSPPVEALRNGAFHRVPIIITTNSHEGLQHALTVLTKEQNRAQINHEWNTFAPESFYFSSFFRKRNVPANFSNTVYNFYFGSNAIDWGSLPNLTNIYGDARFTRGIHSAGILMGKHTEVYLGLLTEQRKDYSAVSRLVGVKEIYGVAHMDDLSYLYAPAANGSRPFPILEEVRAETDIKFSRGLVKLVGHFAKFGIPPPMGNDGIPWPKVNSEEVKSRDLHWFELNTKTHGPTESPFKERMRFWDTFSEI